MFWGQQKLGKSFFLAEDDVIAAVAVVVVGFQEVDFYESFWTQHDVLVPVGAFADAVLMQFQGQVDQGLSHVEQILFGEGVFGVFLFADGLCQGEVVVVEVGVQGLLLYAELGFWVSVCYLLGFRSDRFWLGWGVRCSLVGSAG